MGKGSSPRPVQRLPTIERPGGPAWALNGPGLTGPAPFRPNLFIIVHSRVNNIQALLGRFLIGTCPANAGPTFKLQRRYGPPSALGGGSL